MDAIIVLMFVVASLFRNAGEWMIFYMVIVISAGFITSVVLAL